MVGTDNIAAVGISIAGYCTVGSGMRGCLSVLIIDLITAGAAKFSSLLHTVTHTEPSAAASDVMSERHRAARA